MQQIRHEAFGQNSKVMDTAFYLTDVYGPRLTGSPNAKAAGEWAVKKMTEWGLANTKLETWGPFGRGWTCTRFMAQMKEPEFQPIIGFAQPWSPGTNGDVSGEAVYAVITGPEDLDQWKGKLKGKIVLAAVPHASEMVSEPYLHRLTDAELALA
ncbi:MAG TPA: peptidase M28, partial [Bryobacteraceae bacterium]|nr:peptidase M28 [Bryobacteraceae bacterium]